MHLASETRPQVRRDRLLRLPEVETATGLKKSSIYSLMRAGEFPRAVKLTARCVAWPESQVLGFIQARINASVPAPALGADAAKAKGVGHAE